MGAAARRKAFTLAETLRRELPGLKLLVGHPGAGFKAQMRRADRSGARFALILGDEEVAAERVSLKDLRGDTGQRSLNKAELRETLAAAIQPVE
jgi:histidyl-tRNA synthetase